MAVTPAVPSLRFIVAVTPAAAASLGSSTISIPCAFYLADTALGFQWQIAISINGTWQIISTGVNTGVMYDDGEVPALCTEINSMGLIAWIMKQAGWFKATMTAFFTGKVPGSAPPPPTGDVTPMNFHVAINTQLSTMGARDVDGDGIPELVMA